MKLVKLCFGFVFVCFLELVVAKDITSIEWLTTDFLEADTERKENVAGACTSNDDCNLGKCQIQNGIGVCKCVKGIKGDNCNVIKECDENKDMCGNDPNAKCTFDYRWKTAYCKCKIRSKRFDVETKACVDRKPCERSLKQCKNDGYCAKKREFEEFKEEDLPENENVTYCQCPLGASGDFCERVEGCVKKPNYCGDGNNVECRMNSHINKIYCQCMDQNQRFDWKQKKCVDRKKCRVHDECLPFGLCTNRCQTYEPCLNHANIENKTSCHCVEGTSGHNCKVIDDCYNKVVDCGSDGSAFCTYSYHHGLSAFTYCKCNNNTLVYDDNEKTCKELVVPKDIANMEWSNSVDELEADNKQKENVTGPCKSDDECNMGWCKIQNGIGVCKCEKGIKGDNCNVIKECDENKDMCGNDPNAKCTFDYRWKTAYCKCKIRSKRFDVETKTCVERKPCERSLKQCKNDGYCAKKREFEEFKEEDLPENVNVTYCQCPLGASGDFCERVEGCVKKPNYCGDGNNVECRMNSHINRIYCQCMDHNQRFDWMQKKCVDRKTCQRQDECEPFGRCTDKCQSYEPCLSYTDIENKRSCHCVEGTSGHNCEVIDDCYNKVVDCGSDGTASCKYYYNQDLAAHTYCECKNKTLTYENEQKTCKVCDCGPMGTNCNFKKGKQVCECDEKAFNFGDRCQDCECGEGATGCNFSGEKKSCFCKQGYLEVNGVCERCDCGINSTDCKFDEKGEKICTCEPGFKKGNYGVCTPKCDEQNRCANGGLCLQDICVCLAGTGGPHCETVYECESNLCGEDKGATKGLCKYDTKTQKAYCDCGYMYYFDSIKKRCEFCSCSDGRCEVREGKKICNCYENYAYNPVTTTCRRCDCGSGSCRFNSYGERICKCGEGFTSYEGRCRECNCGFHGACRYISPEGFSRKVCSCDVGYSELDGKCVKCDCGTHGSCRYINVYFNHPIKQCSCDTGYQEHEGNCLKCDCGSNGECSFDKFNNAFKCVCDSGFQEVNGKCKLCDCGPDSKRCSFRKNTSLLQKVCDCPLGFKDNKGYCQDVDECLSMKICSGPGAVCENTIGSYRCRCQSGYLPRTIMQANHDLCQKEDEKQPDYKPWKMGIGFLSTGFIIVIIGLLVVIYKRRRN